ncbi:MAG: esterase/lipase family protein [Nostoc sp. DedQUE01]|nr:alpha/beta fold hydrolase [Nostoc sp. DedQUE01]
MFHINAIDAIKKIAMRKSFSTHKWQQKRLGGKTKFLTTIGLGVTSVITMSVALTNRTIAADFLTEQGIPPLGANNPACRPSAARPVPVVLVHGTALIAAESWTPLALLLASKGYCVYALNYGNRATGPVADSAKELKVFVDNVLALTKAKKVSIVGHSQGGMMPRYYIKFLGGANKVDDLIALAPSNHGTTLPEPLLAICANAKDLDVNLTDQACLDQVAGSPFLTQLNAGDETPGPVSYTVVATKYDEIINPYTSGFLDVGKPNNLVTNITLQKCYPLAITDHALITKNLDAYKFVYDALAYSGPANTTRVTGKYCAERY